VAIGSIGHGCCREPVIEAQLQEPVAPRLIVLPTWGAR